MNCVRRFAVIWDNYTDRLTSHTDMKASFRRRPLCFLGWLMETAAATTAALIIIHHGGLIVIFLLFQGTRVNPRVWQLKLVEKYAAILLDMICKAAPALMNPYHRISNSLVEGRREATAAAASGGEAATRYCQILAQVSGNDLHVICLVTSVRGTCDQKGGNNKSYMKR